MAAINPNDLAKFTGILEVRAAGSSASYTRLASVRGLVANIDTSNIVEIKADDTGTVLKVSDTQASIEAELLENMDRDTLDLLFTGTASDVAAAPVAVTGEALGTGWTVGQPIQLANKDGDNTEVASIVIDAASSALTLNTDYAVYVGDGDNGDLGYTYITPLTAQAGILDADYSYTPNATESFSIDIDTVELKNFQVKITATSGTDTRVTTLSSAAFNGVYGMTYADVVEAGDITGASLTFEANKGSTLSYANEII